MFEKKYETELIIDLIRCIPSARAEGEKARDTRIARTIGISYATLCNWRSETADQRITFDALCGLVDLAEEFDPHEVARIRKKLFRALGGALDRAPTIPHRDTG